MRLVENNDNNENIYEVVVVGGGLAGLSTALDLTDRQGKKYPVVVLEAGEKVGGRTCSETAVVDGNPVRCDVGGAYLGPEQDRVLALCERFNLDLFKVPHKGKSLHIVDSKRKGLYLNSRLPPLSIPCSIDANAIMVEMQALADTIYVEEPWNSPGANVLDSMSASAWIDKKGWTAPAKEAVKGSVQSLTCKQSTEISMLWWLWSLKTSCNLKYVMGVENAAQERKVVQGTAEISSRIAKHLGPECIRLGHIVHEIDTTNSDVIKVTVEVKGSAQEPRRVFYGKHLVVTIPPSLYRTIIWKPNLPTLKAEMGENMPMGSIIKTVMYYKKSCWRDRGLSGEVFDPTPESPVVYCVDDTKPDGSYPAIMGFVTADAGLRLQELDIKERQEIISNHYKTALGIMQEPIGYLEKNWNNEPFVGGCYMNTCPPGVVTSFMKAIRQTTAGGRVHFAGTETAIRWAGYMDGAVESGFRAAAEILNVPFDYRHRPKQSLIPGKPVDFTTLERAMPSIGTLVKTSAVGAVVVAAGVMAGIAVRNV